MIAKVFSEDEIYKIIKDINDKLRTNYSLCYKPHKKYLYFQTQENEMIVELTQEETKKLLLRSFFYQITPVYWFLYHDITSGDFILVWET